MPRIALFLGAGASRAFEYPTTEEFMTNLSSKIGGAESEILDGFRRTPEIKDIEHILQMLDGIIAVDSDLFLHAHFKSFQPQMPTTKGTRSWVNYIASCKSLKERIITELHTQYEFDPNRRKDVNRSYNRLLDMISSFIQNRKLDIFTTNYDRVIEEYALGNDIGIIDGFSSSPPRRGRFWDPNGFQKKQDSSGSIQLRLFKLHGSLNWRETHDGRIESLRTEERCFGTKRYRRNILIYPTQKGLEEEGPFATLLRYFREASLNTDVFFVIGFSFRDPILNEIFLNHLRESPKHGLVVVSPSAKEKVEENLLVRVRNQAERKEFEKQVQSLNVKFGERKTFDRIDKALTIRSWTRPN